MKKLAQGAIATGSGTLAYTVPSGIRTEVNDICIANTSSGVLSLALHFIPTGGSASISNMVFPDVDIPAKTLIQWSGAQLLNAGDSIKGIGSGSGITINISGVEERVGM